MDAIFAVLNPEGRDKAQVFTNGAGTPADPGHAPINYHAYAACLNGGFFQKTREIPPDTTAVLVLLRKNGLKDALSALRDLKGKGKRTFISWKESGLHQVSAALSDAGRYTRFQEICAEADGFLSSTPEMVALYRAAGCGIGEFIPTPYPVDAPDWDFFHPVHERHGIFIGTREFEVPSRNHLLAVTTACALGLPVTVVNTDGRSGEKLLRAISPDLHILSGTMPYGDYLRKMASHRIVFQLDRSAVPGQVAGDALLCRVPCVGGDGAVERLAYAATCGLARDTSALSETAARLLSDDEFYDSAIRESQEAALARLSFGAVAERLKRLIS